MSTSETTEKLEPIVTCVIPAFNEAERIARVLNVVVNQPQINEVIVIDDGSTDNTSSIVRDFKEVKLIELATNRGKAHALKCGISEALGNIILLLDADLIGLTNENLDELLSPVLSGDADMTLSMRKNSHLIYRLLGVDVVSGERAIHKRFLEELSDYHDSRFGFESLLNDFVIQNKLSFRSVSWDNVSIEPKYKKVGLWKGIIGEFKMFKEIFKAVGVSKWVYILFKMAAEKKPEKRDANRRTKH